ncbi:hypothetical protein PF011_g7883 [Phytophthora fragariae]|uniref:HAT C-terminal dimerisation domain-containing protein n=1 Tax=Phytophthora fragariae TaxID=53985 RepID=A0A6A3L9I1_9STRA|nr:hypothetical protein PF011_g7883 [Phytophthora fragariae]
MFAIMKKVEIFTRAHLPHSFGLVFNGWTMAGIHIVGRFAVFPPTDAIPCCRVLLAFSPLEDESDRSAQSLSDFLADTLSEFERPWSCVLFVSGENCSVNLYIGDHGVIPFIGCASHRYNHAVQLFLEEQSTLISRANKLMLKASTVKGRACLAKVTGMHPKFKNETRWSRTMKMLKRCDELIPALRQISTKDAVKCGVDKMMLTAAEVVNLSKLLEDLVKLDSVTVELQSESLTMLKVRKRFDHTVSNYPVTKKYLSATTSIINNAVYERALAKLQSGRKLIPAEKNVSCRLAVANADVEDSDDGEGSSDPKSTRVSFVQQAFKRRRLAGPKEVYIDINFIPSTSNICERLFSQSKLILTDQRRAMKPPTLEMIVFLRANRSLW